MPEMIGGDDDVGLGDAEDVPDLLLSVEVHDRHDHRAEVRRGEEGDRSLDPVRELQHHDVTRSHAVGGERRGERASAAVDVTEGAGPRARGRVHLKVGGMQP